MRNCTKLIPKIYKRNAETLGLFFFVNAQKQIVSTITIEQAVYNYFRFIDIDDWDIYSAKVTFHNMQKEFYEDCKE